MRAGKTARPEPGQGQGQAVRPLDIVLFCVAGALLLVVFMVYSKASSAGDAAARARGDVKGLTEQVDRLREAIAQMDGELSRARVAEAEVAKLKERLASMESRPATAEVSPADLAAAVDAALERRREAFGVDMERRGAEIAAEIAKRVDLKGVGGNLRETAGNFRRGLEEGKERPRTEGEKKADEAVAKGFDAMAEGIELFRKMQAGEITREEFREKTRELRENARKQFEDMPPEERDAIQKRFGGWGGRRQNRDGGGEGAGEGEGGGDEKF